jgi:MFS family permease
MADTVFFMLQSPHPIYNFQFGLLSFSSFLFTASFNMLIPELSGYLSQLGGAEYKGFIIALFTVTAGLSRPFSGKLADTIGRVPVMAFGSLVCFVCGFLYPLLSGVAAFMLLRLVHGFSTGFKPTGTSAYVADLVPATHRGEAMGIQGLCSSTGMALGPVLGSLLVEWFSLNVLFYCSSTFALLSILILLRMKETLTEKRPFRWSLLRLSRHEIVEPRVMPAALVTLLTYVGFGVVLTLGPDWSVYLGLKNKGLFFTVFTLSSLVVRFVAGKVSDRYGRVSVLRVSALLLILGLVLIGMATSAVGLLTAAAFFGFATGMASPTITAWTVDLSHPDHRGKALATMYIALELGIGGGALMAGWIYGNNPRLIPLAFYASATFAALSLLYLLVGHKKRMVPAKG